MSPTCRKKPDGRMPLLSDRRGVTLVEMMVVVVILGIVMALIYGIYIFSIKSSVSHRLLSELQMDTRATIDYMTRELKMLGYDVQMAGCDVGTPNEDGYPDYADYGPSDSGPKFIRASSNEIVFAYKDLSAIYNVADDGNTDNNLSQFRLVRYFLEGDELKRETRRWDTGVPDWTTSVADATLAEDVTGLNFIYYDGLGNRVGSYTGDVLDADLDYSSRCDVRRVEVSVTAQESKKNPISGDKETYTLSTSVYLDNMGAQVAEDVTAPPPPSNVQVSDPHICGRLDVTWVNSPVADLGGYVIEVNSGGLVTQYTADPDATSARIGGTTSDATGTTEIYEITDGVSASVRMKAYDEAGNESAWVTATPSSITPQADAPAQPEQPDATADIVNGTSVTLTWTANAEEDVGRYDIYKREYGVGTFSLIGNASDPVYIRYADTPIDPQQKCKTFEYQVQAVNACNAALQSSLTPSTYGNGNIAGADSPTDGVTNTRPSDATLPASPTGPGVGNSVLAKAGYRRNFINWNNPDDEDLDSIIIRYDSQCGSTAPSAPASADDGNPVEEYLPDGELPDEDPGAAGRSFTHTGSATLDPSLGEGCAGYIATYTYSLFAKDKCGNVSDYASVSTTTVEQCGEETEGPSSGAPEWPSDDADLSADGCLLNYDFTWNRIDDTYPTGIYDLAGYYVYRADGSESIWYSDLDTKVSGLILNPPAGDVTFSDLSSAGYPTVDDHPDYVGNYYRYYVIPIDCNRETNLSQNPWATVANAPTPEPLNSNIVRVTPGRITFNKPTATTAPLLTYYNSNPADPFVTTGQLTLPAGTSSTGYQHNTIRARIYTTSRWLVELDGFTVSWPKTTAWLSEIRREDTDECIFGTCLAGGSISNSPATVDLAASPIKFGYVEGPDCKAYLGTGCSVPLKFVFTDASGNVTNAQDMRFNDSGGALSLDISNLRYTKKFYTYNANSSNTSPVGEYDVACEHSNPRLTLTADDDVAVPTGPEVTAEQETATNADGDTLTFTPSTLAGGREIPSSYDVDVFASVSDKSGAGIANAILYYAITRQGGPKGSSPPSSLLDYTTIEMTEVSTDLYRTLSRIPGTKDKRIWYFILAQDSQGNWDRDPEMTDTVNFTAYTFDFDDPCGNTPNAPSDATAVLTNPDEITLTWSAPTTNTGDGSTLNDLEGFYVYESINNGTSWPATPDATYDEFTTTHIKTGLTNATDYKFKVEAFDECATPNVSTAAISNTVSTPP